MRIGELSRAAGVEPDTVRYYEKAGLLPEPRRSGNGYRAYGPEHLERLAFVRHCRDLDMPLAEVRRLLLATQGPPRPCEQVDALLDEQLRRVRERMISLQRLEQRLTQLRARCGGAGTTSECAILQELTAASQGQRCACHGGANTPGAAPLQWNDAGAPREGAEDNPDGKERERHPRL